MFWSGEAPKEGNSASNFIVAAGNFTLNREKFIYLQC